MTIDARPRRPQGRVWRWTARFTGESRQDRLALFLSEIQPAETDTVLDVGVTDETWRSSNFLEAGYPWPARITGVGPVPMPAFAAAFPEVRFVKADGRELPFGDRTFTIGFSNAVVEHVGDRASQARFVGELLRTCRRVFICTPNAGFPIDPHTLLPFVHWLPRRVRDGMLRWTGNARWAGVEALEPLGARAFLGLFPASSAPRLIRQRRFGLTTVLIVIASGSDATG